MAVPTCDPDFDDVVLWLEYGGADGSTTFIDSSGYAHPMTAAGDAAIETSNPVFAGVGTGAFGPLVGSVETPNAPEFDLSATDWTIETWLTAATYAQAMFLVTKKANTSQIPYQFYIGPSGNLTFESADATGTTVVKVENPAGVPVNQYVFCAATRQGNTYRIFQDGVLVATATGSGTPTSNSLPLLVGVGQFNSAGLIGQMAQTRITKGLARYTASFDPPAGPFIGACPVGPVQGIPNVILQTPEQAALTLGAAAFVLGAQTSASSDSVPAGAIISQMPAPGTLAAPGTAVDVVVSTGPGLRAIPEVRHLTAGAATLLIQSLGFRVGDIGSVSDSQLVIGEIATQTIPAGTLAAPGTKLGFSINVFILPFNVDATVISQYSNSPTLLALVHDMYDYIDPRANLGAFYQFVWNVDTAVGFGLDIWGRIVGVSRLLKIPNTATTLGFENASVPADWAPWNQGTFNRGANTTQAYLLPDDIYRTLVLTKALANIVATSAASLNQLLRNLFPGRGKVYVVDLGAMEMQFVFEFYITSAEYAILTQSGALPHPAGVGYSVVVIDTSAGTFGFSEQGAPLQPFDSGVFYLPAGP